VLTYAAQTYTIHAVRKTDDESRTFEYLTELLRSVLLAEGIRNSSEIECMMVSPATRRSRRFGIVYISVTVPALFIGLSYKS